MPTALPFSEAAQLYAENFSLVETMRKIFEGEAEQYYNQVRDEVQERAQPRSVRDTTGRGYRYWSLIDDGQNPEARPRLFFDVRKVNVIHPGNWTLTGGIQQASSEELAALAAVATDLRFQPYCKRGSGGTWSLFTLELSTLELSLGQQAQIIAQVLTSLHEAFERLKKK